ncbi:hypothetical protein [Streptomyces sp. TR06-5]|uniref:hypothetical protein n=1 Tax=unclassified Streptomyces TaxID=2593676 RepID=UPI0039A276BF
MGQSVPARHSVLPGLLVLLLALVGLGCGGAVTGPPPHDPAGAAAPAAVGPGAAPSGAVGAAHRARASAPAPDVEDASLGRTGCTGKQDPRTEPPAGRGTHRDGPLTASTAADSPGHAEPARCRPPRRPGGPAPPPTAPLHLSLSVLRV